MLGTRRSNVGWAEALIGPLMWAVLRASALLFPPRRVEAESWPCAPVAVHLLGIAALHLSLLVAELSAKKFARGL